MNEAEFLIREFDGALSPDEVLELQNTIDARPEFAAKRRRWLRVAEDLATTKTVSFEPMFRDCVLARLRKARQAGEDTIYVHLRGMFTRVAMAGMGLALVLGVYNTTGGFEFSSTVVETLFGLPAPSLESVVMLADV